MGTIRNQDQIILDRALARSNDELKFAELDIDDEFVFLYEMNWAKRLEYNRRVSKYLPYILSYVKIGEFEYKYSRKSMIWTNSNFNNKIHSFTNGFCAGEADVILIE